MKRLALLALLLVSCSHAPGPVPTAPAVPPLTLTPGHVSKGPRYGIASQGEATSAAGRKMLENGGNVVDAFAAMSFAIGVERPHSTGIGGGGFLLLQLKGWKEPRAFDFRERAPAKATGTMYLDKDGAKIPGRSTEGALSAGVPGLVAGVLEVHSRFGRLPLATVMAPAIELAEKGFPVYPELARALKLSGERLAKFPPTAAIFLRADGSPLAEGDLLVQHDLAETLRVISRQGKRGFYQGPVAEALVASQKKWGGLLTPQDLLDYKPKERRSLHARFGDNTVYSMPPPSSGGVHVLQMLGMLKDDNLRSLGVLTPASVHLLGSAMELAFRERAEHLGDPDYAQVPVRGLLHPEYLRGLRERIPNDAVIPQENVRPGNPWPYESPETTHFTVLDRDGNAVASTQTINGYFGSGLVAEGTGVLFNNEMDDFAAKVGDANLFGAIGGQKNLVQPGKRPLSSMAPTIVMRDGRPVFVTGSPSGTRIISCVFLSVVNYLGYGLSLEESITAPRFHHQWQPDKLFVENTFPPATAAALRQLGHAVEEKDLGCRVEAAALEGQEIKAVADPRGFGSALAQ